MSGKIAQLRQARMIRHQQAAMLKQKITNIRKTVAMHQI